MHVSLWGICIFEAVYDYVCDCLFPHSSIGSEYNVLIVCFTCATLSKWDDCMCMYAWCKFTYHLHFRNAYLLGMYSCRIPQGSMKRWPYVSTFFSLTVLKELNWGWKRLYNSGVYMNTSWLPNFCSKCKTAAQEVYWIPSCNFLMISGVSLRFLWSMQRPFFKAIVYKAKI